MIPRVRVHPGAVGDVMRSGKVRAALRARAEQIAARADQLAASEGYEVNAYVAEGTRPKGRPYAQARSADADQEFGTWGKKRRRILGRAAGLGE